MSVNGVVEYFKNMFSPRIFVGFRRITEEDGLGIQGSFKVIIDYAKGSENFSAYGWARWWSYMDHSTIFYFENAGLHEFLCETYKRLGREGEIR